MWTLLIAQHTCPYTQLSMANRLGKCGRGEQPLAHTALGKCGRGEQLLAHTALGKCWRGEQPLVTYCPGQVWVW